MCTLKSNATNHPNESKNQWETKRNETKRNETKRNETKQNETKRNETKRNETKRNETIQSPVRIQRPTIHLGILHNETEAESIDPISYIDPSFGRAGVLVRQGRKA